VLLIPHEFEKIRRFLKKLTGLEEGAAAHQVVGEVVAHQADDG
jgi:hypothetical protein